MTYTERFDTEGIADELAFAFALFLTLVALWEIVSSLGGSSDPVHQPTEQSVTLPETALERLERGDTYIVHRWHGHDLELSATHVIDATAVAEDDTDGGT